MDAFFFILGLAVGYYLHLILSHLYYGKSEPRSTTITITRISGDEEGD